MPVTTLLAIVIAAAAPSPVPDSVAVSVFLEALNPDPSADVLCLAINGGDPDANVLEQLRRSFPTLVASSECEPNLSGSKHIASGKLAVIVSISNFKVLPKHKAEAHVSVYRNGKSGHGKKVWLHEAKGTWVVEGSAIDMVI